MELSKYLSNSACGRILQFLSDGGEHTTKEIAEYLSDVPVPTLYRHINALIEGNMIIVKEERKVRGSRERVLVVNMEWSKDLSLSDLSYPYFMNLLNRFYKYENSVLKDNVPSRMEKDRLFMLQMLFFLEDDEMDQFINDVFALREKYMKISEKNKGRKGKLRNINFVSAPEEIG